MAVNYTQLFTDIGKMVAAIDELRDTTTGDNSPVPDLPALELAIVTQLAASSRHDEINGIPPAFQNFKDQIAGMCEALGERVTSRLLNLDSVIVQLNSTVNNTDITHALLELARAMIVDSESFNSSVVSIASFTADSGNTGNGELFLTKCLDGVTAPGSRFAPKSYYWGIDSELSVPTEIMSVNCIGDADTNGLTEGHELFLLEGKPAPEVGPYDWRTEGSGTSIQVPTLNSYNMLTNRNFEVWLNALPQGWVANSGAGGTEIVQESTASDVYRGLSSMQLVGTSTNIDLRQTLGINTITPSRMYMLGVAVKGSATIDGQLEIKFVSDAGDYSATEGTFTGTSVDFANTNPDTLVGTWAGSDDWVSDGFRPGMRLQVASATVGGNDGWYTVQQVNGDTLTLAATDSITADTGDAAAVITGHVGIVMEAADLQAQTTWGFETFYFLAPPNIADDLQLQVTLTGGTTGDLHIDSLAFGPVVYGNGIGAAVLAGSTQFALDDRFSGFVTNSEGLFQRFFRRQYGVQMPSDNAGNETLADSLAT